MSYAQIMTPEQKKCSRCKCLRTDFTRTPTRCDVCTDPGARHKRWLALKADPVKYAEFLAAKRETRAKAKAAKESRFRVVVVPPDDTPDDLDPAELAQAVKAEARTAMLATLRKRYEAGESTTEIAATTGRRPGVVYVLLKEAGATFRDHSEATSSAMAKWHALRKKTL